MKKVLKDQRIRCGYSQSVLAELCGIKRNSYNQIERGHRNPSYLLSKRIKKVLNYYNDDLFDNYE
ncbi:helix-turn-helix transcriptional regulator [Anaerovorax sp. IOR16]|uniref:helix-turn-helix transcriptional regulator n=1 Tax=Anaerovorax sp. IOR16 TaxID=2773458 RepID=UPI0019D095CE|nr:helix-turn-helix domain-containing protein [Anaerovorax sp. IOR16]